MINGCNNIIEKLTNFSTTDLDDCREGNKLLGLGLELTRRCNLRCLYCYANSGKALKNELTFDEIILIINQAIELGVKKIGLIGGGETLLYKKLKEIIDYISYNSTIKVSVFTNGTLINEDWINFFSRHNVAIVHKLNSFKEETQDFLTNIPGSFKYIQKSLHQLLKFEYQNKHSLSIETVVTKQNYEEIPEIWCWSRDNNINPIVERLTPQGRGTDSNLLVHTKDIEILFRKLSEIDKCNYNISWEPKPPTAGQKGCLHHLYAIYIKSDGTIQPCSGVTLSLGNIRGISLKKILKNKTILQLRNLRENIKGKCKTCKFNSFCFGCRGASFQYYNDYLAEDPFCWYDTNNQIVNE